MKISDLKIGDKLQEKTTREIGEVLSFYAHMFAPVSDGQDREGLRLKIDDGNQILLINKDTLYNWELVTDETTTNYVQTGEMIEEYVPIDFDKLKKGDKLFNTVNKKEYSIIGFDTDNEKDILIRHGEHGEFNIDRKSLEEYYRLVVKPEPKETTATKTTTNKPEFEVDEGWGKQQVLNDGTLEESLAEQPMHEGKPTLEQEKVFYLRQIAVSLAQIAGMHTDKETSTNEVIEEHFDKELSEWLKK